MLRDNHVVFSCNSDRRELLMSFDVSLSVFNVFMLCFILEIGSIFPQGEDNVTIVSALY
jgi:hypothetical protein